MIQENEQEDDETYSTHSRSPSPYDSVSSDADDEISALKGKKLMELQNANVITTQPKLNQLTTLFQPDEETTQFTTSNKASTSPTVDIATIQIEQKCQLIKPPLPKPLDVKPVPRMRSAPPPPPTHRKSQNAPPRPTWCYLTDFLAEVKMVMCKVIVGDNKIEPIHSSEFYVTSVSAPQAVALRTCKDADNDHP